MTFEDLLAGRDITQLTQEEIKEIVNSLSLPEVERFEKAIRKTRNKTTSKKSVAASKKKDAELEKLLQKGLKKA